MATPLCRRGSGSRPEVLQPQPTWFPVWDALPARGAPSRTHSASAGQVDPRSASTGPGVVNVKSPRNGNKTQLNQGLLVHTMIHVYLTCSTFDTVKSHQATGAQTMNGARFAINTLKHNN